MQHHRDSHFPFNFNLVSLGTNRLNTTEYDHRSLAAKNKSIMAAAHQPSSGSCAASHSIMCQKVVEVHLSLLDELIIFPEGKFTHHQLANNHVAGSTRLRPAAILPPPSTVFTRAHCRRT
eukprot:scaffold7844_cov56-Skeletonema_dohrnii-CCMP3373.AAC.1